MKNQQVVASETGEVVWEPALERRLHDQEKELVKLREILNGHVNKAIFAGAITFTALIVLFSVILSNTSTMATTDDLVQYASLVTVEALFNGFVMDPSGIYQQQMLRFQAQVNDDIALAKDEQDTTIATMSSKLDASGHATLTGSFTSIVDLPVPDGWDEADCVFTWFLRYQPGLNNDLHFKTGFTRKTEWPNYDSGWNSGQYRVDCTKIAD